MDEQKRGRLMKLKDIFEEFFDSSRNNRGEYIEIFKNPTSRELADIKGYEGIVRFIADNRKKTFYAFRNSQHHEPVCHVVTLLI